MSLTGTGLASAGVEALDQVAYAATSPTRVAAIQMTAKLANVEANLLMADRVG